MGAVRAAVGVGAARPGPPSGAVSAAVRAGQAAGAAAAMVVGTATSAPVRPGESDGADEHDPTGRLAGAGSELRRRMRSERRLRLVTLLSLAAVVLVVLPAFFGIRATTSDPVFGSLDELNVPSWAATKTEDRAWGSRWCLLDCRFRERIVESERPFQETAKTYAAALTSAGWRPWQVAECPEMPVRPEEGAYSCWKRDEFTLDLYVSLPGCAVDDLAAQDPAAAGAEETAEQPPAKCVGSTVSIKVRNAITDHRGRPAPAGSREPVGVTPDPTLDTTDPLLGPTPRAS